jgi:hypothetical protein
VFKYLLFLRNEKIAAYRLMGWVFVFFLVSALILISLLTSDREMRNTAWAGLILLAIVLAIFLALRKSKYAFGPSGFIWTAMIIFGIMRLYWLAALVAVVEIFYSVAATRKAVRISDDEVIYPGFPARRVEWREINNIILKDGLLTIDLKNNKLFQALIDEKHSPVDEQEFNEFCQQKLP